MKRYINLLLLVFSLSHLSAQEQTENYLNYLNPDALVFNNGIISTVAESNLITQLNRLPNSYSPDFKVKVNEQLFYELGELRVEKSTYAVMSIKNNEGANAEIEFVVLYEQKEASKDIRSLKKRRDDWMRLCNSHKAEELVKDLYTANAYYYNRGRLIQGTAAISTEYAYMNMPNYALKLTPKHIKFVNENIAYEIGQCSGSYPLPYMLLWEKQDNGEWQVLMDSNY